MRSYNYISIAFLAVMAAAGCKNLIESSESIIIPEKEIILTATREALVPDTRSFRLDDGSVWWSPNEEVSVFYRSGSDGGSKFVSMNTSIAETVELQGTIQMSGAGKEFWAVYPYSTENSCDGSSITIVIPSIQTGVEGNFPDNVFPAMAKGSSTSLPFWNICGGIKISVTRADIKSVTFKGNNGEPLAGRVKVAFNADGHPEVTGVIDSKTEVTLIAPDGGCFSPGKYYYITLLPSMLEGGITMTFSTAFGTGTLTSDKTQIIKRCIFGVLKDVDSKVKEWESTKVEPEAIDLGLSVRWASFNLGAANPEEFGDYFAWGETEPKSNYSWSTYKFELGTDDNGPFSKYVTATNYGTPDNKVILDMEDDAAHSAWGGSWRIPTQNEWNELITQCTWTWTTENGVGGYRISSNKDGYTDRSIFLPAAGWRCDNQFNSLGNEGGYYWTSTTSPVLINLLNEASFGVSIQKDFNVDDVMECRRYYGFSVRPVYGEFIPVSSICFTEESLLMYETSSDFLGVTITPEDATVPFSDRPSFRFESSDESIVQAPGSPDPNPSTQVEAINSGTATITVYASNGLCSSTIVTVEKTPNIAPLAIDLGLSVKWASFNVGATRPEGFGYHLAWGETEPKKDYNYSGETYKWYQGSRNSIIKYNSNNALGPVDNKFYLDIEDDAAHVNWGGFWRMPTADEISELAAHCDWIETTEKGVNGYRVVSKIQGFTDKSIFLPAAGYYLDGLTAHVGANGQGIYWSSSILTKDNPLIAYCQVGDAFNYLYRYYGFSVRPVMDDSYMSQNFSSDGTTTTIQQSSTGSGIDLILMGDAFSDRQIADGTYAKVMQKAVDAFFSEEPYKSMKDLFNVYSVNVVSTKEGHGHGGLALETVHAKGSYCFGNDSKVIDYAKKTISEERLDDALIIVVINKDAYAGTCVMYKPDSGDYGRGLSIVYLSASSDTDTFNGLVSHEAGGHGFAKLADEYAYEDMGAIPGDVIKSSKAMEPYGWYKNVDFTSDPSQVKWSQFIADDHYTSENIGCFEGGLTYWTGVWRPTYASIMRYNTGGFNAPSRYAIWYRINKLAYGDSWNGTYEDFVEYDAVNRTPAAVARRNDRRNCVERNLPPLPAPVVVGHSWREELEKGKK